MNTSLNLPQLQFRNIGKLQIIDIKGDLTGCWVGKVRSEIQSAINKERDHVVVFNLKKLKNIDSLGVKTLIESLPEQSQSGFLKGSLDIMEMMKSGSENRILHVFKNEDELVQHFGVQLANTDDQMSHQRKFNRIHTALPLEFSCKDQENRDLQFRAVVTNLSEGGLFAEYLDMDDAEKSQTFVSPYELTLLKLLIKLPNHDTISAKGKVVRRKLDGEQVGIGIEFFDISDTDKQKIKQFLN